MTELRDARFQRALQSAQDDAAAPGRATREAVLTAAHSAVRPPWWRRLWESPAQWTPLHAAFASVMIATLVTLMWQGRELPEAASTAAVPMEPAASAGGASADAAVTAPSAAPESSSRPAAPAEAQVPDHRGVAPVPAPAKSIVPPAPAAATAQAPAKSAAPVQATTPAQNRARTQSAVSPAPTAPEVAPTAAPVAPPAARQAAVPAPTAPTPAALAPPATTDLAANASAEERRKTAGMPAVADAARHAAREAAPPAAPAFSPPAPAPAPPVPRAVPSAASALQGGLQPMSLARWNELQLSATGRSVGIRRGESGAIDALVDELLASAQSAEVPAEEAPLRVELRSSQRLLGVLELGNASARWLPAQGPAAGITASLQRQRLLREELLQRLR